MADRSESMALIGRDTLGVSSSGGFAQQGTVDWTRLAGGGWSVSLDIVRRISSAGIEPFTVIFAQHICRSLPLGPIGEKHLLECLSQLRSFSSFGDVIWFGFGIRNILRTLVQTSEGASAVALCASLAEIHSPEVSALVMIELGKRHNAPVDFMPSFSQWQAFIEACAGVLKPSTFALKVQTILALNRSGKTASSNVSHYFAALPSDLADVLEGVAKLKSGALRRITVIGGPACAWLAVFADWMLGLAVQVRAEDDTIIYATYDEKSHSAQVIIRFSEAGEEPGLKQVEETFSLRDGSSLIMRQLGDIRNQYELIRLNGRVPWETALTSTFGQRAADLLHGQKGSHLLQAMRAAGDTLATDIQGLRYGQGDISMAYIANAKQWFPELQQLPDKGENLDYPDIPEDPSARYYHFMRALGKSCECYSCRLGTEAVDRKSRSEVCNLVLTVLICVVVHELAQWEMETGLLLTHSGLWHFYGQIKNMLSNNGLKEAGIPLIICGLGKIFASAYIDAQYVDRMACSSWLCSILFAGFRFRSLWDRNLGGVLAAAEAGICIYSGVLLGLIDRYEVASKVHITAGAIGIGARHYQNICSISMSPPKQVQDRGLWIPAATNSAISISQRKFEVELIVESLHKVSACYRLLNKDGEVWVDPWVFVNETLPSALLHKAWGLKCIGGHDIYSETAFLRATGKACYCVESSEPCPGSSSTCRWRFFAARDSLDRCAALMTMGIPRPHCFLIADDECLICFRQAVLGRNIDLSIEDLYKLANFYWDAQWNIGVVFDSGRWIL